MSRRLPRPARPTDLSPRRLAACSAAWALAEQGAQRPMTAGPRFFSRVGSAVLSGVLFSGVRRYVFLKKFFLRGNFVVGRCVLLVSLTTVLTTTLLKKRGPEEKSPASISLQPPFCTPPCTRPPTLPAARCAPRACDPAGGERARLLVHQSVRCHGAWGISRDFDIGQAAKMAAGGSILKKDPAH